MFEGRNSKQLLVSYNARYHVLGWLEGRMKKLERGSRAVITYAVREVVSKRDIVMLAKEILFSTV